MAHAAWGMGRGRAFFRDVGCVEDSRELPEVTLCDQLPQGSADVFRAQRYQNVHTT